MVKRLLKKYHYPPEGQEQALQTVMAQCNKWADDEENFYDEPEIQDNEQVIRVYSKEEDSLPMAAEDLSHSY